MSFLTVQWWSKVLGKQTEARVLFPDSGKPPFPVLYLLHGLSDDSSMWHRMTRLESHAAGYPLLIVMPDGYRGFYTDNEEGPAYARHIGEELPALIERMFPVRAQRDGRAIGGLSMGGYGALRVGLGHAARFCSIHSHSGAVGWGQNGRPARTASISGQEEGFADELLRIFGKKPEGTAHHLLTLAKSAKKAGRLPKISLDCGTDDFLLADNRAFSADLRTAKIPHSYTEFSGGHTWDYWDEHIREALKFHAVNLGVI